MVSRAGMDAVLGSPNRNTGHVEPTILFSQLQGMAVHIRPALIVLDTAADCFAGNENDRSQTRQFVTLLRALAMESGAAVILVSHPSVYGTNSGRVLQEAPLGTTACAHGFISRRWRATMALPGARSNFGKTIMAPLATP